MNRITITERDLTTNSYGYKFSDTVFIPGFALGGTAEVGVPVRCESLSDFNDNFGTISPRFLADQAYPVYGSSTAGFLENAIPEAEDDETEETTAIMYPTNTVDLSWILAKRYLEAGLPIVYVRMNEYQTVDGTELSGDTVPEGYDITVARAYSYMKSTIFDANSILYDKGEFDIKFITSGGYPTFEHSSGIDNDMLALAASRGDSVAIIDHTNNPTRPLGATNTKSVYNSITNGASGLQMSNLSYGTMFTPWCQLSQSLSVPASAVYLEAFATAARNNPNWLAIAGVQRGNVNIKALLTSTPLTNTIADSYQQLESGISINAITKINGYGYCIWGNRTLVNRNASGIGFATSTLNIRNLVSDVKKQLRLAAISCMFEQNNEVLWVNFKSLISPLLDRMVAGYGLKRYKLIKQQTVDKSKLSADVRLYPENTVESFDITVTLTDEDAEVSET